MKPLEEHPGSRPVEQTGAGSQVLGEASEPGALGALRDELEDAIRRAFAEGWHSSAPDYEPIDAARVLEDPNHMRNLVAIQKAAWDVVERHVEEADDGEV